MCQVLNGSDRTAIFHGPSQGGGVGREQTKLLFSEVFSGILRFFQVFWVLGPTHTWKTKKLFAPWKN